jgi:hypothetical protein
VVEVDLHAAFLTLLLGLCGAAPRPLCLPVESFLDIRDGSNYANRPGPIRLYPDFSARMWEAFGCARLVVTGPKLEAARGLFSARDASGDLAGAQKASSSARFSDAAAGLPRHVSNHVFDASATVSVCS